MAVYVAVCEIFSVEKWCDLENRVRVRSRSLEMAPFDKFLFALHGNYGDILYHLRDKLLVQNREIFIPHLYLAPPQGVITSEFREDV